MPRERLGERTGGRTGPRLFAAVPLVAAALALAGPARATGTAPGWADPTPAADAAISVLAGTTTEIAVAASDPDAGDVVAIDVRGLPAYATLTTTAGNPATASIVVAPPPTAHRSVELTLVARDGSGYATERTFVLQIKVDTRPVSLVGPRGLARWGYVLAPATARAAPTRGSRAVARLGTGTPLGQPNLVLALERQRDPQGRLWLRVRLPILPNGSTGWIEQSALDGLHVVHTHLVVDRTFLTATLFRDDRPIFATAIAVGRPAAPTPEGEFYVREKLRGFSNPFYGPIAFGTSGRSAVLTDWPGGGFIGIHGTNQPRLIPGRVSHGCIRMRNAAVLRLAHLMPLGTPVTIR